MLLKPSYPSREFLLCSLQLWQQLFQQGWNVHAAGGHGQTEKCAEANCLERANVGTHIQLEGDSTWYMVALCMKHNCKEHPKFKIKDNAKLALASVAVTCQKIFLMAN
jgi:hypothetical protein